MSLEENVVSGLEGGGIITAFPTRAFEITASDSTEFEVPVTVWVGGSGDVVVEPWRGGNVLTYSMLGGSVVPVAVRRVLAASTATNMNGQY